VIVDCGTGPVFSLDDIPDEPHWLRYVGKLAEIGRVLVFDYPGTGLSDQGADTRCTYETQSAAVKQVLDAAGVERAVVMGSGSHAPAAIQFAVDAPERTERVLLVNPIVHFAQGDDFPDGVPKDVMAALLASIDPRTDLEDRYADDEVTVLAPSLADDPAFRSWWTRSARRAASPAMAREINRMVFSADMLSLLSRITVPALIVQRRELARSSGTCPTQRHIGNAR
jgi:pimeloyl-ACP methyl ester carboxylesterase